MEYIIREMIESDWSEVSLIYDSAVKTGESTFATCVPEFWSDWISSKIKHCSLVAGENNRVVGWCTASLVSNQEYYSGVAEVSVYVDFNYHGMGIGKRLLEEVIVRSERQGIWTLQGAIFPENIASIKMNLKCGFYEVGIRRKIGKSTYGVCAGQWRDVLLMERRSKSNGID